MHPTKASSWLELSAAVVGEVVGPAADGTLGSWEPVHPLNTIINPTDATTTSDRLMCSSP